MTRAERAAVIEECAKVADEAGVVFLRMGGDGRNDLQRTFQSAGSGAKAVAEQIRDLKTKEHTP